jgi:hypothetical protein
MKLLTVHRNKILIVIFVLIFYKYAFYKYTFYKYYNEREGLEVGTKSKEGTCSTIKEIEILDAGEQCIPFTDEQRQILSSNKSATAQIEKRNNESADIVNKLLISTHA